MGRRRALRLLAGGLAAAGRGDRAAAVRDVTACTGHPAPGGVRAFPTPVPGEGVSLLLPCGPACPAGTVCTLLLNPGGQGVCRCLPPL